MKDGKGKSTRERKQRAEKSKGKQAKERTPLKKTY